VPDETGRPEYEQLREDLRRDLREDIRNEIRSALAGLGESPAGARASESGIPWPTGPVCYVVPSCYVVITVPLGHTEHRAVTRFARLGEEGADQ
jgi:hypothetical protein